MVPLFPGVSGRFWSIQRSAWGSQGVYKDSKMFQDVSECFMGHQRVSGFQNFKTVEKKYTRVSMGVSESLRVV